MQPTNCHVGNRFQNKDSAWFYLQREKSNFLSLEKIRTYYNQTRGLYREILNDVYLYRPSPWVEVQYFFVENEKTRLIKSLFWKKQNMPFLNFRNAYIHIRSMVRTVLFIIMYTPFLPFLTGSIFQNTREQHRCDS